MTQDGENTTTNPEITDEQQSILLSLNEICSDESIDTCRKALERNSWNLEDAVMELISPEPSGGPPQPPPVQSVSQAAFAENINNSDDHDDDVMATFDEDGNQIDGFIDRVSNNANNPTNFSTPVASQSNSSSNLRQRHTASNISSNNNSSQNVLNQRNNNFRRHETYADAIRRNRNRNRPSLLQRCIAYTINVFFTTFRLPVTLLQQIARFLPTSLTSTSITSSGRKSPRQEVISSVESIKSNHPIYETLNFTQCSYQDVLTKSKTQVRFLLCYLHVAEHEDTEKFLQDLHPKIAEFMEKNDAIFWACNLNCFEGDKASQR